MKNYNRERLRKEYDVYDTKYQSTVRFSELSGLVTTRKATEEDYKRANRAIQKQKRGDEWDRTNYILNGSLYNK